jgi:hypothetical protein
LFWIVLWVLVAFLCSSWFVLPLGFFRLFCVLCQPVLISALLPECASRFPACFPATSFLSPPSLFGTHRQVVTAWKRLRATWHVCIQIDILRFPSFTHLYDTVLRHLIATMHQSRSKCKLTTRHRFICNKSPDHQSENGSDMGHISPRKSNQETDGTSMDAAGAVGNVCGLAAQLPLLVTQTQMMCGLDLLPRSCGLLIMHPTRTAHHTQRRLHADAFRRPPSLRAVAVGSLLMQ